MATSRKIDKPKSLTLLAMENIRQGIASGAYALGSPLYEKVLAEEFGISKTPVREALVQLQREGLVVVQPHSGTFVFELADGEVAEMCELRLILETNAMELAMRREGGRLIAELESLLAGMRDAIKKRQGVEYQRLDAQFHAAFFKHCGNAYLARSYAMIDTKLQTLRINLVKPLPHLKKLSLEEHAQILKALHDSKIDKASELLSRHIKRSRELMRGLHEAKPVSVSKLNA